jgi:hypothetical protein
VQENSRPATGPGPSFPITAELQTSNAAAHNDFRPSDPVITFTNEETLQLNFDMDNIGYEDLMDYLPLEGGLDNNVFFNSLSGMATSQTPLF